jgi:hypothetical protein
MSGTQDIREWARGQGLDVAPKGKIPVAVMEKWRESREPEPGEGAEAGAASSFGGDSPETRPDHVRPKTWFGSRKERPAITPHRRVSIENVVSYAWGMGAYAMAQNPALLPVARVLDMQAPVAGIVVNDVARGTVIDKALQPLARAGEKGEKSMGLLGPPLLVGAITLRPDLFPVLKPVLKLSIMSWMEISEPAMKKAKARAEKFQEKFGDVDVDGMIDALFAPPPADMYPAPEPAAA